MGYPQTPFDNTFNTKILIRSQNDNTDSQVEDLKLTELLKWLCTPPKISSYRVNTSAHTVEDILSRMKTKITDNSVHIEICPYLPDVILLHNVNVKHLDLEVKPLEVIVDIHCATAVLRGAHIFAPGIMGMHSGTRVGDKVSIYADVRNNCRKGYQKTFESENKVFLGNGVVKMSRSQLFGEKLVPTGVAVEVYSNISGCLTPEMEGLPKGSCLLQNLPSVVCTHMLDPQPGETILDMCAAPGNKTTHIAALMKNEGTVVAIDKTPTKIRQLKETCAKFRVDVSVYKANSTTIYDDTIKTCCVANGPPFGRECFDRILLDAPCSALGKRPQLYNNSSEKVVRSYIPLQRKLFQNAVHLLKVNGRLVYSTCTITVAENECLVAWALNTFKCLRLSRGDTHLGSNGWKTNGISDNDLEMVQRFGPDGAIDSVGFFIACFTKQCSV